MTDKPITLKPLISEEDIRKRTQEIADQIVQCCPKDEEIVVVGLLKGSFMFMADMVRLLHLRGVKLQLDFMAVSSYGSSMSPGKLLMSRDISTNIWGRFVLLMDDILDTGKTLQFVYHHLMQLKPSVMNTCVFLDKPERRVVPFRPDFVGFTVPDRFVVGYGLDYDNRYREMPYIAAIEFEQENKVKG
jgi:hypoxanthine phosphoribosyltransferase